MTHPRCVLAGRTYLITRRCRSRHFFLVPSSPQVEQSIEYCLAEAARIHGILVHGHCALSNHFHAVVTDVRGELPLFMARFSRHAALCMKLLHDIDENVWEAVEGYNAVELTTEEAIFDEWAYTLANPCATGLVKRHDQWPGAISTVAQLGSARQISRPKVYFSERMAESETLQLTMPAALNRFTESAIKKTMAELVQERERQARKKYRRFLGAEAVQWMSPWTRPKSPPEAPRSRIVPTLAAANPSELKVAKARLKAFRDAYRRAWNALRQGITETLFPPGTWALARYGLVPVAPS